MNWNDIFEYRDGVLYWKISTSNKSRKKIGDVAGNQMNDGCIMVQAFGKRMLAHRVVWEMHNGRITNGMHIDHLNHIRNDNRIENLRLVSRTENNRNKSLSKVNKTGVSGVRLKDGLFEVSIGGGKNKTYIGRFSTLDEARAARKCAEFELNYHNNHGDCNGDRHI